MQAAMAGRLSDQLALQLLDLGGQQPLLVGQAVTGGDGGLLQLAQGTPAGLELGDQVTLLAQVLQGGGEARRLGGSLVREGGPAPAPAPPARPDPRDR